MTPLAYAELHCLSNYSFLRGASHPEELVARAWELGYRGLAITDECSLAGAVRAHEAWRELRATAEKEGLPWNFRLVFGAEFRLACGPGKGRRAAPAPLPAAAEHRHEATEGRDMRLVLLAKNRAGYGNLSALITLARRRADKGDYRLVRADLQPISPGGAVPDCFALWLPDAAATVDGARWFAERFGNRARLAVELLSGADDTAWLARTAELAAAANLPRVATGDVHMHVRGRRPLQDTLAAIRLNTTVFEAGTALHPNGERHLRHPLRLARLYPPELLEAAAEIVAQCDFTLDELRYEYPQEIVPPGETPASYLHREVEAGLSRRYPRGVPESVRAGVEKELALVAKLGYEPFFLTVYDIVCFARKEGILCQGRGSAANSTVCYALGITEVDPTRASLLFERFISEERNEPPDIDVDFEHERREIVIQYIYEKYGRERAALAATVIRYRTRGALRDVGRALGFGRGQIDALARSLAWWDKRDRLPARLAEIGLDPQSPRVAKWLALTEMLVGFPRHLSQHVGGFVISRGPLGRLVPIENAAMPERSVIQWDKDDLESLGLLKVDVLALGMLSAIRRSLELVAWRRGRPFGLADVPAKDAATFDMLCAADSVGVFQVESRAQMAMLPRLMPRQFYDLVVQVAIVRPGPIQGDMVHPYLARRADRATARRALAEMPAPVREVLERTLGVPIFQEQVMKLAEVAAGFTPGEADQLRRAMASWRQKGHIERFKQKLREGMAARDFSPAFAEALCRQIEGFGEYGFPESHAASFALLAYSSAWLKCHEPEAFLCGLLNSQPMGFYAPAQLVQDARRHGVEVRPVDVTASTWDALLEPVPGARPAVRLGLREIKGFPQAAAERIAAARETGPLAGVDDLARRAGLERRELDLLAAAGALRPLAGHRRQAAWQVAGVSPPPGRPKAGLSPLGGVERGIRGAPFRARETGRLCKAGPPRSTSHERGGRYFLQGDLFDAAPPPETAVVLPAPKEAEELVADYAALTYSLGRHPLALLRDRLAAHRFVAAASLAHTPDRALVRAAGLVTCRQRPGTAAGVIFVTLEDESGLANVVVYGGLAERQRRELLGARLLGVYGQLQREGAVIHLLAKRLVDLSPWLGALDARSRDFH